MNDKLAETLVPQIVVATTEATHQVVDADGHAVPGVEAALNNAEHIITAGNGPAWIEKPGESAQVPTDVKK